MNGLPLPDRARWLLEACLRDDRRAVEAFGKWRRFANPGQMEGRELRLTPLLHENMRRLGLSDQRLEWIGGQAKHIWLTGALRRRKLLLVLDILEGARVDFVLIKGAAMSARFPKAVATRPMADFDLLIHRSSARAAMATLHASGWSGADGAELSDADLNRHHAIGLWDPTGTSVDLHWRPAASIATCRHAEGVRERSVAASLEGRPVSVASATDHLFVLLCHAFEDKIERRNDWIADVDLLFRFVPPEEWDWRLFHRLACDHQLDRWIRKALATTQTVTGRPPPSGAFRLLGAAPTWRGVLQNREIGLRGFPASSSLDLKARSNGRKARGFVSDAIGPSLDPERAVALALEGQPLAVARTEHPLGLAFPDTIVFLEGWWLPEDGRRWTDADVCVFCVPFARGKSGESFQIHMRLGVLPELRRRLRARAWAGGRVETLVFRSDPEAELFIVRGRLLPRTDGEEGALGVLWLRLDGLFTPDERVAVNDFSRRGVRADSIEALLTSEIAARLPILDRLLPLGGPESDVMAWTGWGAPEGFGRWTVGNECRLRFRRPAERGEAINAVAIDIAQVCSAGGPIAFEVQVGSEAPSRFQFPETADAARSAAPGGVVTVPLPPRGADDAPVEISIRIRDPASPHELGLGEDRRKLGLAVTSIAPAKRLEAPRPSIVKYPRFRGLGAAKATFCSIISRASWGGWMPGERSPKSDTDYPP
jgi:Uncharacterised nucleotidyltransferase